MKHSWIMSAPTFEQAVGDDPELASRMFGATCYVPGSEEGYGTRRIRSHYVRDYEEINDLISAGTLGASDNIVWAIETGKNESDPAKVTPRWQYDDGALGPTIREAKRLCRSVGATLVAAPAGNLMDHIAPDFRGSTTEAQLAHGIAAICARNADMYEVQKQQSLQSLHNYQANVRALAEQANEGCAGNTGICWRYNQ